MKYLKYVPYLILLIFVITLIAGMGTRVNKSETLVPFEFELRIKYIDSEPTILARETIEVIKHEVIETRKLTGEVVDYGCWLTFPGKEYGSASMNDTKLNYQARDIAERANATLVKFGDLFRYDYDIASVWATDCTETKGFVDVELWFTYGQRDGGFLTYRKNSGNETAWLHIPVVFYDEVLKAAVDNKPFDSSTTIYPTISEVGGYRILPDDPNALASWLISQLAFLRAVYSKEVDIVTTPGLYDYTTTTQETYISSYGCQNYNYKGVCTDRGPNYESYTQEHDNQIEVVLGTLVLK